MTMISIAEPRVAVRRTRTAGYQVVYVSMRGERVVLARRLGLDAALTLAEKTAGVHQCVFEVEAS